MPHGGCFSPTASCRRRNRKWQSSRAPEGKRVGDGQAKAWPTGGWAMENGDHKRPFVDGSWSFRRASLEQANFMARAKHLKMASSLWWLERPYKTLACRLAPA